VFLSFRTKRGIFIEAITLVLFEEDFALRSHWQCNIFSFDNTRYSNLNLLFPKKRSALHYGNLTILLLSQINLQKTVTKQVSAASYYQTPRIK